MQIGNKVTMFSLDRPKLIFKIMAVMTIVCGLLMIRVHVDTDPENMLAEDEAVRVFHDLTKKEFNLHDVVVVGVVNEQHEQGVFNPETLKKVDIISKFAATLVDPANEERKVVARNIIAPDTVENIEQAGLGQVRFDWLMKNVPASNEEALKIRDNALANPLLKGSLVSEDGKALAIYLPITEKDFAHTVSKELKKVIAQFDKSDDRFYITGLPVAEDTFGKEMFVQMAISAPLAMLMIFGLMFLFFKKIQLIIAPMIIAMVSVITTMGLLIGMGNTLHIMSSMIPIFIMPIAVVDSIHILSEFFDEYQKVKDRRKTLEKVMGHLFMPMFYTSLTSSAGFASLALTPIPPVQVFGIFVALGILLAWLLTILFIPAYIMTMNEESLADFGSTSSSEEADDTSLLNRHLQFIGRAAKSKPWIVIAINIVIMLVGVFGISKIQVNDNPVKWFKKDHEIRVADRVLNSHFGGTYEAYLVLSGKETEISAVSAGDWLSNKLIYDLDEMPEYKKKALAHVRDAVSDSLSGKELGDKLTEVWENELAQTEPDDDLGYDSWSLALDALDGLRNQKQIFKRPDILNYIIAFQKYIAGTENVGKTNSVADVVQKVHQELYESDPKHYVIPDTLNGVAQTLISFQNSHKPDDLWHLVTPDYTKANIWLQLKSGDNKDMEEVLADVAAYFETNPPPVELEYNWAGLTYINVVWQNEMVSGMLKSFLSSFVVVFIMMSILFRSPVWGGLAMIPLTFTIGVIYGVIGLIGKDYDMPVAVLSSLTLGLAVDFAIHFLERSRATMKRIGDWGQAVSEMFKEPARAIVRNTIVISIGFTPLLFAPLIPYQTVGIFLATIMLYSGLTTMWLLPSLLTVLQGLLFKKDQIENN